MRKPWLKINKRRLEDRKKELQGNPWGSKLLFEELRSGEVTSGSQLFLYQKNQRDDGFVFTPTRVTVNELLSAGLSILDEGNSYSSYLPNQIFDEGSSTTSYTPDEIYDEGTSSTVYIVSGISF